MVLWNLYQVHVYPLSDAKINIQIHLAIPIKLIESLAIVIITRMLIQAAIHINSS